MSILINKSSTGLLNRSAIRFFPQTRTLSQWKPLDSIIKKPPTELLKPSSILLPVPNKRRIISFTDLLPPEAKTIDAFTRTIFVHETLFPYFLPFYCSIKKSPSKTTAFSNTFQIQKLTKKITSDALAKKLSTLPKMGKTTTIFLDGQDRRVTVVGFDYRERPIVTIDGDLSGQTRIITDPKQANLLKTEPGEALSSCVSTLSHGKVYKASDAFCKLMHYALTREIVGKTTGMDYINAFYDKGCEAFVLGGAVRDISREFLKRELSLDEAVQIVNDIDVSCVAGAPTALQIFGVLHKDDQNLHIGGFPEYGCLHAQIGSGDAFDFNAMMIGTGTYDAPRIHQDIVDEGELPPALFGGLPEKCSEALDFCSNALFYDAKNGLIIDPTGYGLEDAVNAFLRLTGGSDLLEAPEKTLAYKQVDLLQRFWKFRMRGMTSNAYTTLAFQTAASDRWTLFKEEPVQLYNDVVRMLPVKKLKGLKADEMRVQLNKMIDQLETIMREDDRIGGQKSDLFNEFIKPNRDHIINYLIDLKKAKK